jgi:two-component system sensor histidine kinase/response regulator
MDEEKAVYIDPSDGLNRVMLNKKLYVKLLNKFKAETSLEDLGTALAAGNLEQAQGLAHTIKGVAANLSLLELHKQLLDLESRIKKGSVQPGVLEAVERCFTHTLQAIDKALEEYGG